tara:strand:- start:13682 stop:14455 length:774 start_codon:yes stop_codon:yes gene_type:complete
MNETKIPIHVLDIRLSGKLTGNDMSAYRSALEAKIKEHQHIGMVVDFTELSDIGAEGLAAGVQADMEFFSHIGQFYRVALVSDKEWPGVIVALIQSLISKPQFKAFASSQRDAAIKWTAEIPTAVEKSKHASSMRIIRSSKDDVMGFEINGAMTADAVSAVMTELNKFLEAHDKVRLLARIDHFNGVDPAVFMHSGLLSMKLAAMQKVERYAVVGAPGWMHKAIETMNPLFPDIDMRPFAADKEAEAWHWLGATVAD